MSTSPHPLTCLLAACAIGLGGCTINATDDDDENPDWARGDNTLEVQHVLGALAPLPSSLQGKLIRVHLRRDALGLSAAGAAGLDSDGPMRDQLSVSGIYRGQDVGWLHIEREDGRFIYFPSSQILAIETLDAPPATP
jgi:hypothetical protein